MGPHLYPISDSTAYNSSFTGTPILEYNPPSLGFEFHISNSQPRGKQKNVTNQGYDVSCRISDSQHKRKHAKCNQTKLSVAFSR